MSSNRDESGASGMIGGIGIPKLTGSGVGYSQWKEAMAVALTRAGAQGVHEAVDTKEEWLAMYNSVMSWKEEERAKMKRDHMASLSNAVKKDEAEEKGEVKPLTEEDKSRRSKVIEFIQLSGRIHSIIFTALSEELRAACAHVPTGWAYGIWSWLADSLHSTDSSAVNQLFAEFVNMKQEEGELFDVYRARVIKLYLRLEKASQQPTPMLLNYALTDRLLPEYRPVILALRTSGQFKDEKKINWDDVAKEINYFERSQLKGTREMSGSSETAMQARSIRGGRNNFNNRNGFNQQQKTTYTDTRPCYKCGKIGHLIAKCPEWNARKGPPKEESGTSHREQVSAVLTSQHSDDESGDESLELGRTYIAMVVGGLKQDEAKHSDRAMGASMTPKPLTKNIRSAETKKSEEQKERGGLSDQQQEKEHVKTAEEKSERQKKDRHRAVELTPAPSKRSKEDVDSALKKDAWGIDTMASISLSGNKNLFCSLKKCTAQTIKVADGSTVTTEWRGTVELRMATVSGKVLKLLLDNVYYHERFSANLLCWSQLRQMKWEMHSTPEETYMLTPGGNKVQLSTRGRVSVLDPAGPERVYTVVRMKQVDAAELMLLHEQLCHIGFDRMIRLIKGGAVLELDKLNVERHVLDEARRKILECKACTLSKGSRTAFGHRGVDRGSAKGECIHLDTYQVKGQDGELEYGLAARCAYTGHRWFARLRTKDEGAAEVIKLVRNAQCQLTCKVKRLYADGGTEFVNHTLKTFCSEHGIELHYPPARTQQLNGIAERNIRTEKEAVRAMMLRGGALRRFWGYAAAHSVYVWNRSHVAESTGMTPYESMHGRKPVHQHLGVFGCDAFMHLSKEQRGALDAKMEACIYLGHDWTQNCAIVYVLSKKKVLLSRDVKYRTGSFANMRALEKGQTEVDAAVEQGWSLTSGELDDDGTDEATLQGGNSPSSNHRAETFWGDDDQKSSQDTEEWEVESISGKRVHNGRTEYLTKWVGFDEMTWTAANNFPHDSDIVREYEQNENEKKESESESSVRRSARLQREATRTEMHSSSANDKNDDGSGGRVHLVMSAVDSMNSHAKETGLEVISAVSDGVSILELEAPKTYREAITCVNASQWNAGMKKEVDSCIKQRVWELVPRDKLPSGANVLDPKWVYRVKTDENGKIVEYKARITPKGYQQKEGVDYFEVFARTGMYKTMRLGLSLAAKWNHELEQMDVPSAFLFAELEEEVYMELPEGFREGKEHLVCRLVKSLYGLKQAPRNWYLLFSSFLCAEMQFRATVSDPCLFFKRSRTGRLILMFVFVDDAQVSYHIDDQEEWGHSKQLLVNRFNIKDMGESKWILGMKISRNRSARTITLDQELYVGKALERYGLTQCKVASTPELIGGSITAKESEQMERGADDSRGEQLQRSVDKDKYMEITGTCIYAAISTRPDISHAVNKLASKMTQPTSEDMLAAKRVLRYLAGTRDIGLIFGSHNGSIVGDSRGRSSQVQVEVCAYADADWANDKKDRRSITGWVAKLNGDAISWASKKQRIVALSTCEAELYAEAAAMQEVLWLRGLLKELGLQQQTGSVVYGDNQSAIAVSKNGVKGERTKHVDIKYHFVTENVVKGDIQLKWIQSKDQQADIFTKALPQPQYEFLRKKIMTR